MKKLLKDDIIIRVAERVHGEFGYGQAEALEMALEGWRSKDSVDSLLRRVMETRL